MKEAEYDVAVIGGGIHGVGVAQAAAAAGYRAVVLERSGLAAGTSSRSSKLIHGGLRYLESAEFSLVRESLKERERLLRLAPDLVKRCDFYVPVYKHSSRNRWQIMIGLTLYALLAGFGPDVRFSRVPRSKWGSLDGLTSDGLKAVFRYTDAQTDDAALTRAVMASATDLGAALVCPGEFVAARFTDGRWLIEYRHRGELNRLLARTVVNAAGPWAAAVARLASPALPMVDVENVKGTHLELSGRIEQGCYYLEVPADKRAVFVLPWRDDRILLGTTEQVYRGDPAEVAASDEEAEYLKAVFQFHFPQRSVDILDRWAGLRVLPASNDRAFRRSREIQLPVDNERQPTAVTILGGKLTGYRATSEKVMGILKRRLPPMRSRADTKALKLRMSDTGGGNE